MCEIRVIIVPNGQVSWLRRRGPEMSLLTTNQLVFSVDNRRVPIIISLIL